MHRLVHIVQPFWKVCIRAYSVPYLVLEDALALHRHRVHLAAADTVLVHHGQHRSDLADAESEFPARFDE